MIEVRTPYDMAAYVGQKLGISDWVEIDQKRIDAFAEVTGDHNWIHVDVDRAARELSGGKTVAHGMLTFSLLAKLGAQTYRVRERSRNVNYGSDRARFTCPVQCGARIRLHRTLDSYEPVASGARLTFGNVVEIEGRDKPALVARTITVVMAMEAP